MEHGSDAKTPAGTLTNFATLTHGVTEMTAYRGGDGDVIVQGVSEYYPIVSLHLSVELATSLRDGLTDALGGATGRTP